MTRVLLLSDTHGYMDDAIIKHVRSADEVWHAGDIGTLGVTDTIKALKPLRAVYGNIDGTELRNEFPEHQKFKCESVSVWMTHIGGYPGAYRPEIRQQIRANPPRLFISGHSHILKVMNDKQLGLLHMNPGAVGRYGFHKARTMLRFTIHKDVIANLEVIEFDR